jgi:Tripartite ATP-independent periplasmic transporter, DctM component
MVEIALVTPPVGFNLFVLRTITGTPIGQIAYAAVPFFLMMLFGGALLIAFPRSRCGCRTSCADPAIGTTLLSPMAPADISVHPTNAMPL